MSISSASYDFLVPQRIVFGWGRRQELPKIGETLGRRALAVLGSRTLEASGAWDDMRSGLSRGGIEVEVIARTTREPTIADVDEAAARVRHGGVKESDWLLAVGGGSAIDLAKAVAAMAVEDGHSVRDYLEGVGAGWKLTARPLAIVAMPTTGGTGTEATKNAVISVTDPPLKKSLRSELLVPHVALVDPELSVRVAPRTTAHTGLDAITQLIESYISRRARPIPRALCIAGLRAGLPALPTAVRDGESRPAREAMAHAALLSGMALANSGLGLAHGVAAALGSHADVAHGLACAVMLPVALRVNLATSREDLATLARDVLGKTSGSMDQQAHAFVERIDSLVDELGIPRRLRDLGVRREQLPALVTGSHGNSLDGNPLPLDDSQLSEILEAAW